MSKTGYALGKMPEPQNGEEVKGCLRHSREVLRKAFGDLFGRTTFDFALEYIEMLEAAQPKWISVEERLPGDPLDGVGEVVELLIDKGSAKEVLPGYYDHNEKDWVIYFGDTLGGHRRKYFSWWHVIKWRPLPEPPKEEA